jgi:DNA-directed RNA polymerase subunit RPC12/RpoP
MDDEPQPMKALVTRKSGVPEVVCPGCGHINRFADFDTVIVFICAGCGEPIEVIEPVQ